MPALRLPATPVRGAEYLLSNMHTSYMYAGTHVGAGTARMTCPPRHVASLSPLAGWLAGWLALLPVAPGVPGIRAAYTHTTGRGAADDGNHDIPPWASIPRPMSGPARPLPPTVLIEHLRKKPGLPVHHGRDAVPCSWGLHRLRHPTRQVAADAISAQSSTPCWFT